MVRDFEFFTKPCNKIFSYFTHNWLSCVRPLYRKRYAWYAIIWSLIFYLILIVPSQHSLSNFLYYKWIIAYYCIVLTMSKRTWLVPTKYRSGRAHNSHKYFIRPKKNLLVPSSEKRITLRNLTAIIIVLFELNSKLTRSGLFESFKICWISLHVRDLLKYLTYMRVSLYLIRLF